MAEKIIPGIPDALRISILQQTEDDQDVSTESALSHDETGVNGKKTVLQEVMRSDGLRNEVERKIRGMHPSTVLYIGIVIYRLQC